LGGGEGDTTREPGKTQQTAASVVSRGLLRGSADRLTLIQGGPSGATVGVGAAGTGQSGSAREVIHATHGATALKAEPIDKSVSLGFSPPNVEPVASQAYRRAEAKLKGYVGEACPECANFTLVRNGTCMKCDTCGSTTGCS
ncbi:MAG: vitamin B12-dependent ribonucleotide reductase, partial [Alphaproteobacteria bacterium]